MPDLVKLRNRSGRDLEVAFLQGREVKAGDEVTVAGRLVGTGDPATEGFVLADDAIHIAHPTADEDQVLAWPAANWELVVDKPTQKDKE